MNDQITAQMNRLENLVKLSKTTDWGVMEPGVKDKVLGAYETIINSVHTKMTEIHLAALLEEI